MVSVDAGTISVGLKLDTQDFSRGIRSAVDEGKRGASGITGAFSGIGSAVSKSMSGLATFGLAAGGVTAVTGAVGGLANALGFGLQNEMEQVRASFNAFTKDGAMTEKLLGDIRKEAAATPFGFREMATAGSALYPVFKSSGIAMMDLLKQAEILAASNPLQGLEGASFSLREAMTGDFTSIIERFNLSRSTINKLKDEGKSSFEIISTAMKEMGFDADLVSAKAQTMGGRWSTFMDTIDTLRMKMSEKLFEGAGRGLDALGGFVERNMGLFERLADLIGVGIGKAIEMMFGGIARGAQGIGEIIGWIEKLGDEIGFLMGIDPGAFASGWGTWGEVFRQLRDEVAGIVEDIRADLEPVGEFIADAFRRSVPVIQEVFTTILPPIQSFASFVIDNFKTIATVVGAGVAAFATISTIVGFIVPITAAIVGFVATISGMVSAFAAMSSAVGPITAIVAVLGGPLTIAILGISAAVAAFALAWSQNWGDIQGKTQAVIDFVVPLFQQLIDNLMRFAREVAPEIAAAWQNIQLQIQQAVEGIAAVVRPAFEGIAGFIREHGDLIRSIIEGAWNLVRGTIENVLTVIGEVIKLGLNVLQGDWSGAWENIKTIAQTIWDQIKLIIQTAIDLIPQILELGGQAITAVLSALWEGIKLAAQTAWDGIKTLLSLAWDEIKVSATNAFNQTKDAITGAFQSAWDWIKENVSRWPNDIIDFFRDLPSTMADVGRRTVDGFVAPFRSFGSLISGALNAGISVINGFIGAVNGVLSALGISAIPTIGGVRSGGGGVDIAVEQAARGAVVGQPSMYVVGEDAPAHPEFIIPENPAYRARALSLWMQAGRAIGVTGFQDGGIVGGAMNAAQGAVGAVADVIGDVVEGLGKVAEMITNGPEWVMQQLVGRLSGLAGIEGLGGQMVRGVADLIKERVFGLVSEGISKKKAEAEAARTASAGGLSGPIGEGVLSSAQVRDIIMQAAAVVGVSLSEAEIQILLARAWQESNFNPNAINLWDVNAQNGTPSIGLMQTIGPTFNAYYPGGNIYDPLHNMIAALRYIYARYGGPQGLPGLNSGYASGTEINAPHMAMIGEDAPQWNEFIIPSNPAYRTRAFELWMKAGSAIGVPGYQTGGATSSSSSFGAINQQVDVVRVFVTNIREGSEYLAQETYSLFAGQSESDAVKSRYYENAYGAKGFGRTETDIGNGIVARSGPLPGLLARMMYGQDAAKLMADVLAWPEEQRKQWIEAHNAAAKWLEAGTRNNEFVNAIKQFGYTMATVDLLRPTLDPEKQGWLDQALAEAGGDLDRAMMIYQQLMDEQSAKIQTEARAKDAELTRLNNAVTTGETAFNKWVEDQKGIVVQEQTVADQSQTTVDMNAAAWDSINKLNTEASQLQEKAAYLNWEAAQARAQGKEAAAASWSGMAENLLNEAADRKEMAKGLLTNLQGELPIGAGAMGNEALTSSDIIQNQAILSQLQTEASQLQAKAADQQTEAARLHQMAIEAEAAGDQEFARALIASADTLLLQATQNINAADTMLEASATMKEGLNETGVQLQASAQNMDDATKSFWESQGLNSAAVEAFGVYVNDMGNIVDSFDNQIGADFISIDEESKQARREQWEREHPGQTAPFAGGGWVNRPSLIVDAENGKVWGTIAEREAELIVNQSQLATLYNAAQSDGQAQLDSSYAGRRESAIAMALDQLCGGSKSGIGSMSGSNIIQDIADVLTRAPIYAVFRDDPEVLAKRLTPYVNRIMEPDIYSRSGG